MHPVFGESNEYIPALDIPPTMGITAQKFKPVKDGNLRQFGDYQLSTLFKNTPPAIVHAGYDKKICDVVTFLHYENDDDQNAADLLEERRLVGSLNDKNILKFYGVVYAPKINRSYFVFESFDFFLSQLFCEAQQMFEPSVIKCVMTQLLTGLQYLHDKGIVHRDITPKNLVITEKGFLKISNFRSAQRIHEYSKVIQTAEFSYQPLDTLLESETISTAEDIWSATCIFAELLLKKKLFQSVGKIEVLTDIVSILGFPGEDVWPEFFKLPDYEYLDVMGYHKFNFIGRYFKDIQSLDLLQEGFTYNPKFRISADEFLNHSYFQEDPKANSIKCFGGMLHGKSFKFPVEYINNPC